ncbi:hypothetical protein [Bradyrhizobium sp. JR19.8]|uniref:hypothetical protein n=1 Tax=Bradyrhizobium sp. JR19.8 TaxID=3156370 RepID=UPI003395C91E
MLAEIDAVEAVGGDRCLAADLERDGAVRFHDGGKIGKLAGLAEEVDIGRRVVRLRQLAVRLAEHGLERGLRDADAERALALASKAEHVGIGRGDALTGFDLAGECLPDA